MGIHVPTVLDALLEATADEATAKARIASLRATLEEEARRRFLVEGAAPSWNAPQLGKVRLDPPGDWTAQVADDAAFGSWVAEHHPTEATVTIVVGAVDAASALGALEFAGVTPIEARTEVRPAWRSPFLSALTVDVEEETDDAGDLIERRFVIVDPGTGTLPEGLTANRSAAKLVVSLDRDRRTRAIESAQAAAGALLDAAATDDGPEVDRAALDERRHYLEGLHGDVLAAYAGRLELGKSGTKAELAERIARTEAITGRRELIPASALDPQPSPSSAAPADAPATAESEAPAQRVEEGELGDVLTEALAIEAFASREGLRAYAKAKGIAPSGTKADVAERLAAAGHTADDVNTYLTQENTP